MPLLVADDGSNNAIARSMQLLAGRTGQEYNQRKNRKGAFWQDRNHATAVQSNEHLMKCIACIDLNMLRAGVVKHPRKWIEAELQKSNLIRQSKWTQSIAVGDKLFVMQFKKQLGIRFKGRKIIEAEEKDYQLRDEQIGYRGWSQNLYYWELDHKSAKANIP